MGDYMYSLTLSQAVDGIQSVEFPRLTWAMYKKLTFEQSRAKGKKEAYEFLAKALFDLADPKLTDKQISELSGSDFEQLVIGFDQMIARDDEWSGGQFKLNTPIDIGGDMEIRGFTFRAQKLGEMWTYFSEDDKDRKAEIFLYQFGRPFGNKSEIKDTPLSESWFEMMDAADMLFIGDKIAGKSVGGSASWKKL